MKNKFALVGFVLLSAYACKNNAEMELTSSEMDSAAAAMEAPAEAEVVAEDAAKETGNIVSSRAARENPKDSVHKFIRTANLKFETSDVARSTVAIEDVAIQMGGFVCKSNLSTQVFQEDEKPYSVDSLMRVSKVRIEASVVIRVPVSKLDSTLKLISKEVKFLDYRNVDANEVSRQLLAGKMSLQRLNSHDQRQEQHIDKGGKLNDVTGAEDSRFDRQMQADQQVLNTLELKDQIQYSTVELDLYQAEMLKKQLIESNVDRFEAGIGTRMGLAIHRGCSMLEWIVLALMHIWPLLLIGGAIWGFARFKKG